MNLSDIRPIADCAVARLRPFCERIEIAGSIRRGRAQVNDIEICCIPKRHKAGLFGDDYEVSPEFIAEVNRMPGSKGSPDGKYTRRTTRWHGGEIGVDIFMTVPELWGSIFAIRTGSADFSHYVLAKKWNALGWRSVDGVLVNEEGERKTFKEEEELFEFLGIQYVFPSDRDRNGEEAKRRYYEYSRQDH